MYTPEKKFIFNDKDQHFLPKTVDHNVIVQTTLALVPFLSTRIMGRHVREVESRVRGSGPVDRDVCPFSVDVREEGRSVFEVLMSDDGVSQDLAVNLIMALLRTGIDSVGTHCNIYI